jgi:23S rRNA (cytosine1962-C5)-methyltransferase
MRNYSLIDSGNLQKLEKFGPNLIIRPCMQAIWRPKLSKSIWANADFIFIRDTKNKWINKKNKQTSWIIDINQIKLLLKLTDFGHIGFFPEHVFLCEKLQNFIKSQKNKLNILNLFAYSGLASLIALKNQAKICHVDSSKPTINWAKENVKLNNFENLEIRWILEDVFKFLKREVKRNSKYDGIILDPPSFGRGAKNEVFKIEKDIYPLLDLCKKLLLSKFSFIIFSCHTPGFTKNVINNFLMDVFQEDGFFEIDELLINSQKSYPMPCGFYAIWQKNGNRN